MPVQLYSYTIEPPRTLARSYASYGWTAAKFLTVLGIRVFQVDNFTEPVTRVHRVKSRLAELAPALMS